MKKKMIITILGIAVMAALAGCSGKGNEKDKGTEGKTENTQKEDSTAGKEDGASGEDSQGDQENESAESRDKADAQTDDQELLTTAEAFVKDLIEGSEENIKGNYEYTDQMKPAVENGQIFAAFQDILHAVGELKEVQPAWESEPQSGYSTVQVPCDFAVHCGIFPGRQDWRCLYRHLSGAERNDFHTGKCDGDRYGSEYSGRTHAARNICGT